MTDTAKDIKKIAEEHLTDSGLKTFFDWITQHKIYTIVLIILITLGFGRLLKHYKPEYH